MRGVSGALGIAELRQRVTPARLRRLNGACYIRQVLLKLGHPI